VVRADAGLAVVERGQGRAGMGRRPADGRRGWAWLLGLLGLLAWAGLAFPNYFQFPKAFLNSISNPS
jgi:hypothetical protein